MNKKTILCLLLLPMFTLLCSCAKDSNVELKKRFQKARKLVSVLHTNHFFRQGSYGEEFVIEAQLRSLASKPIQHIILNINLFDKNNKLISAIRQAVKWKKNLRLENRKSKIKEHEKWLLPGKTGICQIVFYAYQLEKSAGGQERVIRKKKNNKIIKKINFQNAIPANYSITIHSVVQVGDRRKRRPSTQ